jgi:chemotaxis protein MotB
MSRKKSHGGPNHERWLVSYADFVTMIFALFVVLFASARSDRPRQSEMAAAMQAAFSELGIFAPSAKNPALTPANAASTIHALPTIADAAPFAGSDAQRADLLALKKTLESSLSREIREHTVALRFSRDGLVISLLEVGFFDSGSATPKPSSAPTIQRIASQLRMLPNELRIEGHTDDVPIHSLQFASNWELSTARAATLARAFVEQYNYNPEKLSAAGYAEYHPCAPNSDEQGRARNRRVDLVVLPRARFLTQSSQLLRQQPANPDGNRGSTP